jgi:hypothetical protein
MIDTAFLFHVSFAANELAVLDLQEPLTVEEEKLLLILRHSSMKDDVYLDETRFKLLIDVARDRRLLCTDFGRIASPFSLVSRREGFKLESAAVEWATNVAGSGSVTRLCEV